MSSLLSGRSAALDGSGAPVEPIQIPTTIDRFGLLQNWVEKGVAPGLSEVVTSASGSRPMCSYPNYPHYESGDPAQAGSYRCATPASRQCGLRARRYWRDTDARETECEA